MRPLLYAAILTTLTVPAVAADNTVLNCEQVGNGSLYCYPASEALSQQIPGQSDTRRS